MLLQRTRPRAPSGAQHFTVRVNRLPPFPARQMVVTNVCKHTLATPPSSLSVHIWLREQKRERKKQAGSFAFITGRPGPGNGDGIIGRYHQKHFDRTFSTDVANLGLGRNTAISKHKRHLLRFYDISARD